jgi:hypothetical protein
MTEKKMATTASVLASDFMASCKAVFGGLTTCACVAISPIRVLPPGQGGLEQPLSRENERAGECLRAGLLLYGERFPRQGRLIDPETDRRHEAAIRCDPGPGHQYKQVTGYYAGGRDTSDAPVPDDLRLRGSDGCKRIDRLLGPVLGPDLDQDEGDDDRVQGQGVPELADDGVRDPDYKEEKDHRFGQLLLCDGEEGHFVRFRNAVGAGLREPLPGFLLREAVHCSRPGLVVYAHTYPSRLSLSELCEV